MAIKIKDSFADTNGTNLESHTPSGTGAAGSWTRVGGSAGALQINSNRLDSTTGNQTLYYGTDNGTPDHYAQCTAGANFSTGWFPLVVRATDEYNLIGFRIGGTGYELYELVSASFNYINSAAGSFAAGDVFYLEISGTSLTVKKNGSTVLTGTSSFNSTATKSGMLQRLNASTDVLRSFESGTLTNPPNAPTGVTVGSITAYTATASWTDASSDETGFKVQVAASPYSTWTSVATTAANATSQAITGLTDGTAYKVRVASTNANGDSAWVESGIFTTVALTKLRAASTTTSGAWTAVGAASLHGAINETPASDAEYATTAAASTMKVKITTASNPGTTANHSFQYRAKGDGVSQLTVALVQGDPSETTIKTVTITPTTSFATYTVSLSSGEAATITDYTSLYFKFTSL